MRFRKVTALALSLLLLVCIGSVGPGIAAEGDSLVVSGYRVIPTQNLVVAEVTNDGPRAVSNIAIKVILKNNGGRNLALGSLTLDPDIILTSMNDRWGNNQICVAIPLNYRINQAIPDQTQAKFLISSKDAAASTGTQVSVVPTDPAQLIWNLDKEKVPNLLAVAHVEHLPSNRPTALKYIVAGFYDKAGQLFWVEKIPMKTKLWTGQDILVARRFPRLKGRGLNSIQLHFVFTLKP